MQAPIQAAPVFRGISTASTTGGVRPSDTLTEQTCDRGAITKYCFWGASEQGCDATGSPYITCKA